MASGEIPHALDYLESATQIAEQGGDHDMLLACRDLADQLEGIATGPDLKRAIAIADKTRATA